MTLADWERPTPLALPTKFRTRSRLAGIDPANFEWSNIVFFTFPKLFHTGCAGWRHYDYLSIVVDPPLPRR
jgi:hypothetical protein